MDYLKNVLGENVQIAAACTLFLLLGFFGARYYELLNKYESGYYNRAQYMRLLQYVLGVAPLLFLLASFAYKKASAKDSTSKNHMFVYILYACLGLLGLASASMLMNDVLAIEKKSNFTADSDSDSAMKTLKLAKSFAIIGLIVFSLHVAASLLFAFTKNTSEVFSVDAFKTAVPSSVMSKFNKSSSAATAESTPAPSAFGMNDLLNFGKRRKRYLH